jgi:hypothetical protein
MLLTVIANSFHRIYKDKYMDEPTEDDRSNRSARKNSTEKKPREKSRTRRGTIFGRKKSTVAKEA